MTDVSLILRSNPAQTTILRNPACSELQLEINRLFEHQTAEIALVGILLHHELVDNASVRQIRKLFALPENYENVEITIEVNPRNIK